MATPQENLRRFQEIANRGLQDRLSGEKRARFDEAVRRGLVTVQQSPAELEESTAEQALIGLGRGFTDVGEGMAQVGLQAGEAIRDRPLVSAGMRGLAGLPGIGPLLAGGAAAAQQTPEGAAEDFTREAQEERALFERGMGDSTAASVGRFAGNVLPALVAPTTGAARSLPGLAKAVGGEAGISAAQEFFGFVPEGGSRAEQTAMGGLFGAGGRGTVEGLGAGARGLASRARGREAAQTGEIQELSERFNVPVTQGERSGNQALQRLETQLERIPAVGIRGFREQQSESLKRAAGDLRGKFDPGTEDVGGTLQKSLDKQLKSAKKRATQLYDRVEQLSRKAKQRVLLQNTSRAASNVLSREQELRGFSSEKAKSAARRFDNIVDEFTTDTTKTSSILDASGKPFSETIEAKGLPFGLARKMRSRFNAEARKLEKQVVSGTASDEELAAFNQIRAAFERDIADFAKREGGSILNAYQRADEFFRENVVPFKERQFRRVLSDDFDTDNILATFIKRDSALKGRGKQAGKLVGKLDLEGKKAVKFSILSEAFDRATNVADDVPFSPAKFANEIQKLSDANKVIFSKPEKAQLDGFVKLAEATKRAGQFAENPPTGVRAADLLVGGGAIYSIAANPAMTAAGLGGMKSVSLLLTTETGRKILEKMGRLRVGSKNWQRLEQQAASEIARVSASRASAQTGANQRAQESQSQ